MTQPFKARLRAGETLCGTILSIGAPEVAELLAAAGFDWLFVDAEHGALDPRDVLHILAAVADRTPCLVRIPSLDEAWIKRALDAGADGIIVPQVETEEEAREVARLAQYPPRGRRGLGTARANAYGMGVAQYLGTAAERVSVVVQAETTDAVRHISAIARVPGIDAVFVGPYDLSASLGFPGEVERPEVRDAIAAVATGCRAAGVRTGLFAMTPAGLAPYLGLGFTLLAAGVDTVTLGRGALDLRQEFRGLGVE
ncbi:MAG TPA: aldolase/citrate lyase family protein [Gemmatimonadales bacterium]|nr:aldolase/citrate lyase family protein [Gemmatimonadales bacterium]